MKDLIEALKIFSKYYNEDSFHSKFPTHCEHDELNLFTDLPVLEGDVARLGELGFHPSGEDEDEGEDGSRTAFYSFRFGSC